MSNKKLLLFVIFVGLQLVVIGGFFAQRLYTLSTGTEVVLRTVPIDPRDLIRGEYVALRYEISNINSYLSDSNEKFSVGDTVYVTLQKSSYDDIWRAIGISKSQPTDYGVAIKGKVTSIPRDNPEDVWQRNISDIGIEYGIEKYFVPAGQGKELERSGRLKVFVKVDRSGASVIERAEPTDSRGIDDWDFEDGVTVPRVAPPTTQSSSDARIKGELAGARTAGELYFDRFGNYGEPFALGTCPISGGTIFFRDDRIRQIIARIKAETTNQVRVQCAAGGPGTESVSSSWALSAPLRSGGSWCVDSLGSSRMGVASGGGARSASCL